MYKKIVFNSQRRTSSTYMSTVLRQCLPTKSSLFFEKIDLDMSNSAKVAKWKTSHQNEIQVNVVRNPIDIAISELVMNLANQKQIATDRELPENLGENLLTNDTYFIRLTGLILKKTERYLDAVISVTDSSHLSYKFEDTTDNVKRKLVVKDILEKAGYTFNENDYEDADEHADIQTTYAVNHIVVNPANRDETYQIVRDRFNSLLGEIDLTPVNTKYALALEKCIAL